MHPAEKHAEFSTQVVKTNLAQLSPELLLDIVLMLPRSDLKSLRLVNRVLCDIASSKMFESISVRDDPQSLKQLEQIARSQIWASQVRYIEWLLRQTSFGSGSPWPTNPVVSPSGDIHPYLILQCEYLRLLPSIKIVHFTGRLLDTSSWLPEKMPDHYVLIKEAKMLPSIVRAGDLSLKLGYGPSGCIQELSISGITSQFDNLTKARGRHALSTHPWRKKEAALNPLVFRSIAWKENHFTPTHCTLKDSLFHQHIFWRQLFGNPSLRSLKMENIVLMSCENEADDPFEAIMGLFKERALDATIPVLKVTMNNIAKEYYEGIININESEIDCWIKDQDSHWLATKQDAFTPFPEDSDTEDSGDDESFLDFFRHFGHSELEDKFEAAASEHGAHNIDDRDHSVGGSSH